MRFLVMLLALAPAALAGEYAVLVSGGQLRVDRHEIDGARVRLFMGASNVELDAAQIVAFAPDAPAPAPAPIAAVSPAPRAPEPGPEELADAAADRYGLPRSLVRGVMQAESASNPAAVSPKGAIGLMQLLPGTARLMGADPHDPAQNVDAGTRYLRDLLVKYKGLLWHALAAYNAGPASVDRHNGVPPFPETIGYIRRVDRLRKQAD